MAASSALCDVILERFEGLRLIGLGTFGKIFAGRMRVEGKQRHSGEIAGKKGENACERVDSARQALREVRLLRQGRDVFKK